MKKQSIAAIIVIVVIACLVAVGTVYCISLSNSLDQQKAQASASTQTTVEVSTLHIPIQPTVAASPESKHRTLEGEKVVGDWVCYNEDGHSYLLVVSESGLVSFFSELSDTPLYRGYVSSRFHLTDSPYVVYYIDSKTNEDASMDIEYYEDGDFIYYEFLEDGKKYETHLYMERMN